MDSDHRTDAAGRSMPERLLEADMPRGALVEAPIRIVLVYLLITVGLFLEQYFTTIPNATAVVAYCLVNFAALFLGWSSRRAASVVRAGGYRTTALAERLLLLACCATIAVSLNSVLSFYPNIWEAFKSALQPGMAYEHVKFLNRNGIEAGSFHTGSLLGVILTSLSFTKYYVAGLSILSWRTLRTRTRLLVVVTAAAYTLQAFAIGAMVNIGSVFVASTPFILVATRGWIESRSRRQPKRTLTSRRRIVLASSLVAVTLLYFLGSRGVFVSGAGLRTSVLLSGMIGMVFYLTHGYVGLSYCLRLPFEFTWGHTTLRGLSSTLLPYLGVASRFSNSYLVRSEQIFGWSALQVWSTVFPWLASDFTFWLVPIIFVIVGRSMKRSWVEGLVGGNPFALAFFGQLLIFCAMIPANNQLFNTFGNSVATIVIWILYRVSLTGRRAATWAASPCVQDVSDDDGQHRIPTCDVRT